MTSLMPGQNGGPQTQVLTQSGAGNDIYSLLRSSALLAGTKPLQAGQPLLIDLTRFGHPGITYWRILLNEGRAGYAQQGKYSEVHGMRADGSLYCDQPGVLRNTFLVNVASTPDPAGTVSGFDRMTAAEFAGTMVVTGYQPSAAPSKLFKETSATNPAMATVAGYDPVGTGEGVMSIRRHMINDTPFLWICLLVASGVNNIEIISDLANPPTSSTVPVGNTPCFDTWQTGIDGSAVLCMVGDATSTGTANILAVRTDLASGSAVVSAPRAKIRAGGYFVGESGFQGWPLIYAVEPTDSKQMQFLAGAAAARTDRGRLISMDARANANSLTATRTPLDYVTFATTRGDGIVVCDRHTHWYLAPGRVQRMGFFDDRKANSDRDFICCGHYEKSGRFAIEVNEVASNGSSAATVRQVIEWDFDLWAPRALSFPETLSTTGVLSVGGARLPWSTNTNVMQCYADGSWHYQYCPPLGVNGYGLRHTAGAAAGTGQQYAAATSLESYTWPQMEIDGLEGMVKLVAGGGGVFTQNIAAGSVGNTPASTGARLLLEELSSGFTGTIAARGSALLFTDGEVGTQRRMQRRFFNQSGTTGVYLIQPRLTLTQASTGTDATRYTANAFSPSGVYMEGFAWFPEGDAWSADNAPNLNERMKALDAVRA